MRSRRRSAPLSAAALLVLAVACLDIKHTNPFDPGTPVVFTLVGPETLFSVGGLVQYHFATVPPIVDKTAQWGGGDSFFSTGDASGGLYYSFGAPLWPATDTVTLRVTVGFIAKITHLVGSRSFSGTIIITQRLVRLTLRCPDTHACDTLSVGVAQAVYVDGADSLGSQISGLKTPTTNPLGVPAVATFTMRDTTVASVATLGMRVATVTAKKSGSTWMVARRDQLSDSVRIVVR